ncbi:hypothetical protein C8Q77DRAFT_634096 [Trametes polyzona]|nr:hypothetical protein C8Q77DRAFT_634096 [Trametes polyzona]
MSDEYLHSVVHLASWDSMDMESHVLVVSLSYLALSAMRSNSLYYDPIFEGLSLRRLVVHNVVPRLLMPKFHQSISGLSSVPPSADPPYCSITRHLASRAGRPLTSLPSSLCRIVPLCRTNSSLHMVPAAALGRASRFATSARRVRARFLQRLLAVGGHDGSFAVLTSCSANLGSSEHTSREFRPIRARTSRARGLRSKGLY